jgi:AmmeMemoRadiSam system protein B
MVASVSSRPRLRPIETVVVHDPRHGRALLLRDTQGVAPGHALLPLDVLPILGRFTGSFTCEEIARQASRELGEQVPVEAVVNLATKLEEAMFVDGPPYRRERARIEQEFASASIREASHAGGAYHGDPAELSEYIDVECLGLTGSSETKRKPRGARTPAGQTTNGATGRSKDATSATSATSANGGRKLVGLVAPHIDPWRGARCYGAAYNTLAASLPDDVDTFILLGTSHAPMRQPFALCRKTFATPLGPMEADVHSIDAIAAACDFDPYADQFNHKREHSLEFQAVFLRHLLGKGRPGRKARIIPILAGLGEHQYSGKSPSTSKSVTRFLDAVRKIIDTHRAVVIAGADLAHVGPRFGDPRPFDEGERTKLDATDRNSLACAERVDAEAFWEHVAGDLETRRVCGLAPVYSLLRTIDAKAHGEVRHYEQTIDPDEGSIVSHAAMGFYV